MRKEKTAGTASKRWILSVAVICALPTTARYAAAETLDEALAAAYDTNPELRQARDRLRQADEQVNQAGAQVRPGISVGSTRGYGYTYNQREKFDTRSPHTYSEPSGVSLTVKQPIWTGGRTDAAMAQAEAGVQKSRADLQDLEQNMFSTVADTYLSVLSGQNIVRLYENNVGVMQKHLEAAQLQFELGEATRTDVAQAQSRLARTRADLKNAEGQLATAEAEYHRHVGHDPGVLTPPAKVPEVDPARVMPDESALRNNPSFRSALHARTAAESGRDAAQSELMPYLQVQSQLAYDDQSSGTRMRDKTASSIASLTVPIYQGGAEYSRIRTAEAQLSEAEFEAERIRRRVEGEAASASAAFRTAVSSLEAEREQVRAAGLALEGVHLERMAGTRTLLEELDAEQELLNAKVSVVKAEQQEKDSRFRLAAATGTLNPELLGLTGVKTYDPGENYDAVHRCWIACGAPEVSSLPVPAENNFRKTTVDGTSLEAAAAAPAPAPTPTPTSPPKPGLKTETPAAPAPVKVEAAALSAPEPVKTETVAPTPPEPAKVEAAVTPEPAKVETAAAPEAPASNESAESRPSFFGRLLSSSPEKPEAASAPQPEANVATPATPEPAKVEAAVTPEPAKVETAATPEAPASSEANESRSSFFGRLLSSSSEKPEAAPAPQPEANVATPATPEPAKVETAAAPEAPASNDAAESRPSFFGRLLSSSPDKPEAAPAPQPEANVATPATPEPAKVETAVAPEAPTPGGPAESRPSFFGRLLRVASAQPETVSAPQPEVKAEVSSIDEVIKNITPY